MRKTTLRHLLFLTLTAYLFVGCVKQEKVSSIESMETTKLKDEKVLSCSTSVDNEVKETTITKPEYGPHTDEIQEFLSAIPLGSEVYLEQKESGEWYLKIEKTFSKNSSEMNIKLLALRVSKV